MINLIRRKVVHIHNTALKVSHFFKYSVCPSNTFKLMLRHITCLCQQHFCFISKATLYLITSVLLLIKMMFFHVFWFLSYIFQDESKTVIQARSLQACGLWSNFNTKRSCWELRRKPSRYRKPYWATQPVLDLNLEALYKLLLHLFRLINNHGQQTESRS